MFRDCTKSSNYAGDFPRNYDPDPKGGSIHSFLRPQAVNDSFCLLRSHLLHNYWGQRRRSNGKQALTQLCEAWKVDSHTQLMRSAGRVKVERSGRTKERSQVMQEWEVRKVSHESIQRLERQRPGHNTSAGMTQCLSTTERQRTTLRVATTCHAGPPKLSLNLQSLCEGQWIAIERMKEVSAQSA